MGLPLYIAPVESDLRNKGASRNAPAQSRSTIRRQRRRSTEAMRESRRRAIFAAAASYPSANTPELQRERDRELANNGSSASLASQQLDDDSASYEFVPVNIRERLVQRFLDRVRQTDDRDPPVASGSSAERWQDSPWASLANAQQQQQQSSGRRTPGAAAVPASSTASSATTAAAARLRATASGSRPISPVPRHIRHAIDEGHFYSPFVIDDADLFHRPDTHRAVFGGRPDAPAALGLSVALMNGYANRHPNIENAGRHGLDGHDDREQLPDAFIVETDPDADVDNETDPVSALSSFRRNRYPSGIRPTVGWLDSTSGSRRYNAAANARTNSNNDDNDNEANHSRANDNAGDDSAGNPPEASATADRGMSLRDAWLGHPYEPTALPPIRMILGGVDGLGDRSRSLSPEGDSVWDTLLSTLTPDPQPPSLGSSFTSAAPTVTATAAGGSTGSTNPTTSSGRPRLAHVLAAAVPVSALVSPPATTSAGTESATESFGLGSSGTASGTTSVSTSQRVRSPFTGLSLSTDTANTPEESTMIVLQEAAEMDPDLEDYPLLRRQRQHLRRLEQEWEQQLTQETEADPACDESEMDGDDNGFTGVSRNGTYLQREEISQERSTLRAGGAGRSLTPLSSSSSARRGRDSSTTSGTLNSIYRAGIRRRHNGSNNNSSTNGANSSTSGLHRNIAAGNEDTLELLGIGGMQNIVRNLARRQDIPDEWWAEAGLSRTLDHQVTE